MTNPKSLQKQLMLELQEEKYVRLEDWQPIKKSNGNPNDHNKREKKKLLRKDVIPTNAGKFYTYIL